MKNLLDETIEVLTYFMKSLDDVIWIGDDKGEYTIEDFKKYANKLYDNGYGSQQVEPSLLIVGDDWWLERAEYDGSEWWEFKLKPTRGHSSWHDENEIFC